MSVRYSAFALLSSVLAAACASPSAETPLTASRETPTGAPLTRSSTDAEVLAGGACGYRPPPLLSPAKGSVVAGKVPLVAPLLEGPCAITASVVFTVRNSSGATVFSACDNDLPAQRIWDSTASPNGAYRVSAQRACSCNACAEASHVDVTVEN